MLLDNRDKREVRLKAIKSTCAFPITGIGRHVFTVRPEFCAPLNRTSNRHYTSIIPTAYGHSPRPSKSCLMQNRNCCRTDRKKMNRMSLLHTEWEVNVII